MSSGERGFSIFKPRARLLSLLGEQLITNEVIAIVELVKNAFDADAMSVTITLQNVSDIEHGEITIEDNGVGMTLDTILNVWLEPGTEFRKTQREKGERSLVYNRPFLGEKGIGRFAAHRLGNVIEVITRTEDSELEVEVEVNWLVFEQSKYLNEVPVNWMTRKPKVFTEFKHGTRINIGDLKKAWNQDMVSNLKGKLEALQAPLAERYNFEIRLVAPEFPKIDEEKAVPFEDILETSVYSFEGNIGKDGKLDATYNFQHAAFPEQERKKIVKGDLRKIDPRNKRFSLPKGGLRSPFCGPFDVKFYAWDLDPETLKETVSRKYYNTTIQPHTGVRVYRDGFRVWPYGETGNDWLNLDSRRVNNPTKCLSNNQTIALVNIFSGKNPKLRDKTDREGIIDNDAFEDFKNLTIMALHMFEIERENDKRDVMILRKRRKRYDRTTDTIDNLRKKMKKHKDFELYKNNIKDIDNAYFAEVRDTIEPLVVSAGIGIAYLMPAHEISASIQDLDNLIKDLGVALKSIGVGGRTGETIPKMLKLTAMIRDVAEGALQLTSKKGTNFSLRSVIDFALYIKKPSLRAEKIEVKIVEKDMITIRGQQNLIMTCILNTIDNSIYWLSSTRDKFIQLVIDHDENSNPRIIVSDNGEGIKREDLQYLGEAFWTRKPRGTGLGLFICKRAMKANNGEVDFGFHGEEQDFLSGANVIFRFSPNVEIKSETS